MKDLIIIGNGMAGMTAALYAKRANLDFKLVGKDEYDFGQIGNAILVENYPCAPAQSGFDLAMNLHSQLEELGVKIEEHNVEMISHLSDGNFMLDYDNGTMDWARTIIYACGASYRELSCEIEAGIPLHHCALCDGPLYKDKSVAVIGGGDVAFTQAEYLSKICKQVIIVMCDENVTAAASTFERVKNIDNIDITYNFPVAAILKASHGLFGIYKEKPNSELYTHYGPHVDGIFVAIGMIPNNKPLTYGLNYILDMNGNIMADENGRTACPGLFAAGDIRQKQVRQSVTAAADGANAVTSVINYLKS